MDQPQEMPRLTLHRRSVLLSLAGLAATAADADPRDAWTTWKSRFLTVEGRVVDDGQAGRSHSEGQAYGLLLAQAHGDQDTFERIEGWTAATLASRQDPLMAWSWQNGQVSDWRNATDGDLLRAWALLRAGRDSGWAGYERQVAEITRAISDICLKADPRAPGDHLLVPFDLAPAGGDGVLVNPSYYLLRAMIELGEATGETRLVRAAAHGERLLSEPAALRDWVLVTPGGLQPPRGYADRFGWDGLRLPLYLGWSGRWQHPAMAMAAARFDAARLPGHVATVTSPEVQPLVESDLAGFRAVASLASRQPPPAADRAMADGYYPATLALLAQIAWAEGGGATNSP